MRLIFACCISFLISALVALTQGVFVAVLRNFSAKVRHVLPQKARCYFANRIRFLLCGGSLNFPCKLCKSGSKMCQKTVAKSGALC